MQIQDELTSKGGKDQYAMKRYSEDHDNRWEFMRKDPYLDHGDNDVQSPHAKERRFNRQKKLAR
jgi:hypothetical protein